MAPLVVFKDGTGIMSHSVLDSTVFELLANSGDEVNQRWNTVQFMHNKPGRELFCFAYLEGGQMQPGERYGVINNLTNPNYAFMASSSGSGYAEMFPENGVYSFEKLIPIDNFFGERTGIKLSFGFYEFSRPSPQGTMTPPRWNISTLGGANIGETWRRILNGTLWRTIVPAYTDVDGAFIVRWNEL